MKKTSSNVSSGFQKIKIDDSISTIPTSLSEFNISDTELNSSCHSELKEIKDTRKTITSQKNIPDAIHHLSLRQSERIRKLIQRNNYSDIDHDSQCQDFDDENKDPEFVLGQTRAKKAKLDGSFSDTSIQETVKKNKKQKGIVTGITFL